MAARMDKSTVLHDSRATVPIQNREMIKLSLIDPNLLTADLANATISLANLCLLLFREQPLCI